MTSKILCATDGTAHSAHAVELAATMAAKLGAKLSICAVNVAHGGSRGPLIYTWEDAQVKQVLDAAAAVARKMGATQVDELSLRSREAAGDAGARAASAAMIAAIVSWSSFAMVAASRLASSVACGESPEVSTTTLGSERPASRCISS